MTKKSNSSPLKVLLNSGVYSITSVLQKGVNFLLIPLFTLYLTPRDYGITGIVNSITTVLSLLFSLSLNAAVQRYYYKYKDDWDELKKFNGTIILFILLNSFLMGSILIIFQKQLLSPFINGIEFYPYILFGVITIMVNPVYLIYQSFLQTIQDAKGYAINSILHFTLLVGLNVLFIVVFQWGAAGQLLSALITGAVFLIHSIYSLLKRDLISFEFDINYLKESLYYSVPLLPHLLSTSIATLISRLLLNNLVSTASAGLFNIASQFSYIIDVLMTSVNSAYIPWFYSIMDKGKDSHNQIIKFANVTTSIYLLINLAISLYIKEIIQLFTHNDFLLSWTLVPILMLSYQIRPIYLYYVNTLFYNTKATKLIFVATLSASFVNIIISSLFTKTFGLMTPAVALLVQTIVSAIIVYLLSRKVEPVDFDIKYLVLTNLILIVSLFFGLKYDYLHPQGPILLNRLIFKAIIWLVVFLFVLFIMREDLKNITIRIKNNKYKK